MTGFVPKTPDFEARIRDSFGRQGAMARSARSCCV